MGINPKDTNIAFVPFIQVSKRSLIYEAISPKHDNFVR